ncbi:hypothetical protein I7I53_02865 [Histoplasma capsulatum var. duboisii H88]|uniref:Uncharacterized protein n=1 Tax=Ajellomyces capsulatus (strain H88) TaxID=544711 RepID=A0A8A1LSX4_AJEC8|nr:hypothetical protein I7I53_02865 [Histoplasma capsulatum var. duboisii H88]
MLFAGCCAFKIFLEGFSSYLFLWLPSHTTCVFSYVLRLNQHGACMCMAKKQAGFCAGRHHRVPHEFLAFGIQPSNHTISRGNPTRKRKRRKKEKRERKGNIIFSIALSIYIIFR